MLFLVKGVERVNNIIMALKSTKLYNDTQQFKVFEEHEKFAKEVLTELEDNFKSIIVENDIDYDRLINDTKEYILSMWWNENKEYYPKKAKRDFLFDTQVYLELNDFIRLSNLLRQTIKKLQDHAPTITKKGVEWNLKKSSFDRYLNPDKKDHYNALMDFQKAWKKVKEFEQNNHDYHLVRFSENIINRDGNIEINLANFKA